MANEAGEEDNEQQPVTRSSLRQGKSDEQTTRHDRGAGNQHEYEDVFGVGPLVATRKPFETRPHDVSSIRRSATAPVTYAEELFNADFPKSTSSTRRGTGSSG